jgi:FHA domain-containing protein
VASIVLTVSGTVGARERSWRSRDRSERIRDVRALTQLRNAYAAGHVSTSTLEARIALALTGDADGAVWDLPPRWWHRRRAPRALVFDGIEWPLDKSARIGRSSSCDLVLRDDSVSRRHAEIALRGGVCVVRDLGSSNGTWVNGRAVQRARLRAGDELQLGETFIRVR